MDKVAPGREDAPSPSPRVPTAGGEWGPCSGTAAVGNISLHLSNETKPRENTHEKEGKEKLLGNKIKVLPSKTLSCSYEETQIALIAAAARSAWHSAGVGDGLGGTQRSQHPAGRGRNTMGICWPCWFYFGVLLSLILQAHGDQKQCLNENRGVGPHVKEQREAAGLGHITHCT